MRELNLADAELNGPMPALYRLIDACEAHLKERDALRVEVEQLRKDLAQADADVQTLMASVVQLHTKIEHLRANALMWRKQHDVACETLERNRAEIWRLRAALLQARDAVAGEITLQRGGDGPWMPANADDPLLAVVEKIDAVLEVPL
jgi:chromosome segregation ATPase